MFNAPSSQISFLRSLRVKIQNFTEPPSPLLRNCKRSSLLETPTSPLRRMLADYSRLHNHPKWGFIIYRCDYRDDSVWARFIDRWSQLVNAWLIRKRQRELIETLEWTVREDRAAFDGATVEDVRKLFTAWTETEEAVAEQRAAIDLQVLGSPRYFFCIHVDAKALDHCLRFDSLTEDKQLKFWNKTRDPALGHAPYVNLVKKSIETVGTLQYDDEEEEEDDYDDDDDEVEVISVKVHWQTAIPDTYFALNQAPDSFQAIARDVDRDGVHLG